MKKFILLIILLFIMAITAYSWAMPEMVDEFEYSHIEDVEIKGSLFDITIEGKDISRVTGKIETSKKEYMLYHKKEGSTLVIWFEKPWWAIFSSPGKHTLTMQVPAATNIHINNSSGKVDVKNLDTEEVSLKTSSGKIFTENIKADQGYKSSSGDIIVNKVFSSGEISFKASSGNVNIDGFEADLQVRTSSGKIIINNANGEKIINSSSGEIRISSSNGNIESHSRSGKHTYKDISGNIMASASSGKIIIASQKGSLELSTSSGKITGEDINITADSSFKTTSGIISIDYTNPDEDFTFDLITSSGKLKAGSTIARKELRTGDGSITIKGKSTSGDQTYE